MLERNEKNWNEEEINYLKKHYVKKGTLIAKDLGRTVGSVRNKAYRLKIKTKRPDWKKGKLFPNSGYTAIHHWVRKNKPKPKLCEICGTKPPYDVANISGKYLRDVNDYKWICRRCHLISDGRLYNNLKQYQKN